MKLIANLQGHSVIRALPEDVVPRNGVPWPELIEAVSKRYRFANQPPIPNIVPGQPITWVAFQNGEIDGSDGKVAIQQIAITTGGAIVTCNTTDQSDLVLADLAQFLDHSFEFRIAAATKKRDYVNDVVVEFDHGIEQYLAFIGKIEGMISSAILKNESSMPKFALKRIAFGREGFDPAERAMALVSPLDIIETTDFVIERRIKVPYSENRYYSRAPLRSSEHFSVLEQIEEVMSST